jgi:predicted esterase YcpF (UPF0227 family)
MEPAAKGTTPGIITEEIAATTEEIVAEVKDEVIETPSRLRQALHRLAALWDRVSVQSSVSRADVVGSGLGGMYGAKFQALAQEHEQGRSNKG